MQGPQPALFRPSLLSSLLKTPLQFPPPLLPYPLQIRQLLQMPQKLIQHILFQEHRIQLPDAPFHGIHIQARAAKIGVAPSAQIQVPTAAAAHQHAAERMSAAPVRCPACAPPFLDFLEHFPADDGGMVIPEHLPLASGPGACPASHLLLVCLPVYHIPHVCPVLKDGADCAASPCESVPFGLSAGPALLHLMLYGGLDALLIKNLRYLCGRHALCGHPEDASHNLRFLFLYHKPVPVPGRLFVPERTVCADEEPPRLSGCQGGLHLDGQVFAVEVVEEVSERHLQLPHMSAAFFAVISIVHGDEPHAHEREYLLQVRAKLDIVSGKP